MGLGLQKNSLKNFDEEKERHLVGTKTLSQCRSAASKNVNALTSKLTWEYPLILFQRPTHYSSGGGGGNGNRGGLTQQAVSEQNLSVHEFAALLIQKLEIAKQERERMDKYAAHGYHAQVCNIISFLQKVENTVLVLRILFNVTY